MSDSTIKRKLWTRTQAAEFLQIKPQTLSVWAMSGRYNVPFVRVGRAVRYDPAALEKWIAKRTTVVTVES